MGLIKAAVSAIGSGLGDQWLEVLEANDMGGSTVFTSGVPVRPGKGSNTKGSSNIVSNGSKIHVYPNQFMLLVDGGKGQISAAMEALEAMGIADKVSLLGLAERLEDIYRPSTPRRSRASSSALRTRSSTLTPSTTRNCSSAPMATILSGSPTRCFSTARSFRRMLPRSSTKTSRTSTAQSSWRLSRQP